MASLKKPVDWDQLYPGRFLKAGELLGKKVTLTIKDVDLDELESDKGKKVKGVVSWAETTKQIALNKTNGIAIREMFGRHLPDWIGKRVTWFQGTWNGDDCLRVWGSPDIAKDMTISVQLPRKKPFPMELHRVVLGGKGGKAKEPEPPPMPVDEVDAGEMFGNDEEAAQ